MPNVDYFCSRCNGTLITGNGTFMVCESCGVVSKIFNFNDEALTSNYSKVPVYKYNRIAAMKARMEDLRFIPSLVQQVVVLELRKNYTLLTALLYDAGYRNFNYNVIIRQLLLITNHEKYAIEIPKLKARSSISKYKKIWTKYIDGRH